MPADPEKNPTNQQDPPGESGDGAESKNGGSTHQAGGGEPPKTVALEEHENLKAALKEEREARKALSARLDALSQNSTQKETKSTQESEKPLEPPKFEMPELGEDSLLEEADKGAISQAMDEFFKKSNEYFEKRFEHQYSAKEAEQQGKRQIDALIREYQIFRDDNKTIQRGAVRDLTERIKSDRSKTPEEHAVDVSKEWSALKAAGKTPAAPATPTPPNPGSGAGAHVRPKPQAMNNFDDAADAARKAMDKAAAQAAARGGSA